MNEKLVNMILLPYKLPTVCLIPTILIHIHNENLETDMCILWMNRDEISNNMDAAISNRIQQEFDNSIRSKCIVVKL